MPAQPQTRQQALKALLQETQEVLTKQFPEAKTLSRSRSKTDWLKKLTHQETDQALKLKITQEEFQATMDKLNQLVGQTAIDYQDETLLYLEQQLSDILGFNVSASLEDHYIPFIGGVMQAMPHLKRTPTDELEDHEEVLEAGLREKRSFYGWFSPSQLTAQAKLYERYYFSLPLSTQPQWQADPKAQAKWFKYRKLIMVNPKRKLAVVGVVADIGPFNLVRAQFGGSPEVIRLGQIWHPQNKGRVALFFVQDPDDQVPLGPIKLDPFKQLATV